MANVLQPVYVQEPASVASCTLLCWAIVCVTDARFLLVFLCYQSGGVFSV